MIAYSRTELDHLMVLEQTEACFKKGLLTEEELKVVQENYPVHFYTPNYLMRIGLFIMSSVIVLFSFSLIYLMVIQDYRNNTVTSGLFIVSGILTIIVLEWMIQEGHYQSGVDDACIFWSAVFLIAGINLIGDFSSLSCSASIFIVSAIWVIRYAHPFVSIAACLSLLFLVFFTYLKAGDIARATMPFVLMAVTGGIYILVKLQQSKNAFRHYSICINLIRITTLICFYAAGNYYVVREAGVQFLHLALKEGENVPFSWFFWSFTVGLPFLYIFRGLQQKDLILLRIGICLVAAAVFTVRYYYFILPLELAMIAGGIVLISLAYSLIRYLQQSRYGFTSLPDHEGTTFIFNQLESLIIAKAAVSDIYSPPADSNRFGGGSSGGAGATGNY
jgi:hypothetical protein